MRLNKILVIFFLFTAIHGFAQDSNLDSMLDAEMNKKTKNETQYTDATFKTSRLVNGHSVETTQKGVFDLKISHRFGRVNQGPYELFGLDIAMVRIGGDYGISNRLTIGGGRSSFEKQYDAFLKYRLLWQSTGKHTMPISLTLVSSTMLKTLKTNTFDSFKRYSSDRYTFAFQALIARKFNSNFSMQLMPTMLHYNIVPTANIPNDLYSIGAGARLKLTKRTSLTAEYYYQLPGRKLPGTYNSFSLGYEIETGGHVFQLHVSNSTGMTERTFINETYGRWGEGDIHFGFNISRVFNVNTGRKKMPDFKNYPATVSTDSTTKNVSLQLDTSRTHYVQTTFASTHLINGQSVETIQKGLLNFTIQHRFSKLNDGFYKAFGLDSASMRIGFEYGITNRLEAGFGRSTFEKQYDAFLKYRLLWQTEGKHNMPISLTLVSSVSNKTIRENPDTLRNRDKYYYAFEAIFAHKFDNEFSLQLMPALVHYNKAPASNLSNDLFALGTGARVRLTQNTALTFEYYQQLQKRQGTNNSFSIGYEIETAGHVFQLHLTNSKGMTDRSFITETKGRWEDGDIHFGFNISRLFVVKKAKSINE